MDQLVRIGYFGFEYKQALRENIKAKNARALEKAAQEDISQIIT